MNKKTIDKLKAEKDLREIEEKYRTLLETTSEGFGLLDPEHKIMEVNKALCTMLGYSQNEMLGKTPFDFVDDENRMEKKKKEDIARCGRLFYQAFQSVGIDKESGRDFGIEPCMNPCDG